MSITTPEVHNMSSVEITVKSETLQRNVEKILETKLKKGLSDSVRYSAAVKFALAIADYVPYKTGKLLRSNSIVSDGDDYAVRYSAHSKKGYDYASVQYEADDSNWNRTTPGTYSHWDKHLTRAERQAFYEEVADDVVEAMND